MQFKQFQFVVLVCLCVWLGSVCPAVEEPNDIVGVCYSYSGTTSADPNSGCPSWDMVLDRNGEDGGHLTVYLDACQIVAFDVNSIPQGTPTPISTDVQKDDLIVVWDEDAGHGEQEQNKGFIFINISGIENPNGYIADPNCAYVKVTTHDDYTNWMIYRMLENGTVTITDTGYNEHGVIRLYRNQLDFDKVDDVNDLDCRGPGQEITYTICWENSGVHPFEDDYIIDWLPDGVTYEGAGWSFVFDPNLIIIPPDPSYQAGTHAYIFDIGTIDVGDANCVSLTVTVNYAAEPGLYLHNMAEMVTGDSVIARAFEDTRVCCWGDPNVIYVDSTADGYNNGTSWTNAYIDLTDALYRAANSVCSGPFTVYVAAGTYAPRDTENGFVLPDGVSVYGGFPVGGGDLNSRNPKKYKTIFTGLVDDDAFPDADTVVTMGNETLLEGFTITQSLENAVYGNVVDFSIEHCTIQKNYRYGIYAKDGDVAIQWCMVRLNDADGIQHEGEGFTLSVDNSWILRNGEYGVYSVESTPIIKNSIVSESDLTKNGRQGIRIENPTSQPKLYNNTISNNKAEGIYFEDNGDITGDPNKPDLPDIQNCIVYYNNSGKRQLKGLDADNIANFCCIQDCNSFPLTTNYNHEPEFAYVIDPNGTPDPNNYHLAYNAFCIDKGNDLDLDYIGQVDIDGEGIDRKYGDYVDIGADEVYSCDDDLSEDDVYNSLDWDADGLVNFEEYSAFARAWLSRDPNDLSLPSDPNFIDPNDFAGWNPRCNLVTTGDSEYVIDLADVTEFIGNGYWLWTACWKANEILEGTMMMSGGEGMMMGMETFAIESVYADSTVIPAQAGIQDPYAAMSTPELVSLVMGIDAVLHEVDALLAENPPNTENLLDIKDFLEEVLSDIKESRQ